MRLEVVGSACRGGAGAGARAPRRPPSAPGAAVRPRAGARRRVAELIARRTASTSCTPSWCARRRICPRRDGPPGGARSDRRAVGEPGAARTPRARPAGAGGGVGGDAAGALRARAHRASARVPWSCRRASAMPSAAATASLVVPNGVDARRLRVPRRAAAAGAHRLLRQPRLLPERRCGALARRRDPTRACAPRVPAAELHLVGARPARAVRALARTPGVSLAAAVPDDGAGDRGRDGRAWCRCEPGRASRTRSSRRWRSGPRWSRRRPWRPALDVRAGRAPAGGRRCRGAGRRAPWPCCATRPAPAPWPPRRAPWWSAVTAGRNRRRGRRGGLGARSWRARRRWSARLARHRSV